MPLDLTSFIIGSVASFVFTAFLAVVVGIAIWIFKREMGEEGYPCFTVTNRDGVPRVSLMRRVWPLPVCPNGEPSDRYRTYETSLWTNLFGSEGTPVYMNKDDFMVIEGADSGNSFIIDGMKQWQMAMMQQNMKLRQRIDTINVQKRRVASELMRLKSTFKISLGTELDKFAQMYSKMNPFIKYDKKSAGSSRTGGGYNS